MVVVPVVPFVPGLGRAEHQVLEQVSQAAAAFVFVGRSDVVPDLGGDDRQRRVGEVRDTQAVVQHLGNVSRWEPALGSLGPNGLRAEREQDDNESAHPDAVVLSVTHG